MLFRDESVERKSCFSNSIQQFLVVWRFLGAFVVARDARGLQTSEKRVNETFVSNRIPQQLLVVGSFSGALVDDLSANQCYRARP